MYKLLFLLLFSHSCLVYSQTNNYELKANPQKIYLKNYYRDSISVKYYTDTDLLSVLKEEYEEYQYPLDNKHFNLCLKRHFCGEIAYYQAYAVITSPTNIFKTAEDKIYFERRCEYILDGKKIYMRFFYKDEDITNRVNLIIEASQYNLKLTF